MQNGLQAKLAADCNTSEQDGWTSKYELYGRFGMTSAYGMVVSCGSAKTR